MIGIIICCCYKYISQYKKIFQYWSDIEKKYNKFKIFFLFGNPNIEQDTYDKQSKKLFLKVDDTYEALPTKIYRAVSFILNNYPKIKGIFKTDDDISHHNIDGLMQYLLSIRKNNNINYCGLVVEKVRAGRINKNKIGKCTNKNINNANHESSHYCYGAGYYISKQAMTIISINKEFMYDQVLEDVSVGHILNCFDIYPSKINFTYTEINRK